MMVMMDFCFICADRMGSHRIFRHSLLEWLARSPHLRCLAVLPSFFLTFCSSLPIPSLPLPPFLPQPPTPLPLPYTHTHSTTLSPHRTYTIILLRHINALRRTLIRFRRIDNPLLDIGRQAVKGLFDIDVALGRYLHEGNAELVGELLTSLDRYRSLFFPVAFVSDQDFVDAFGGVLLDVGEPGSDIWCFFWLEVSLLLVFKGEGIKQSPSPPHPLIS